jgi:hypothetical protein
MIWKRWLFKAKFHAESTFKGSDVKGLDLLPKGNKACTLRRVERLCYVRSMWTAHPSHVDKHGRTVHHGTAQSAHLTDTQTSPFANRLAAVCQCALFPLKLPCRLALLHWLCQLSTKDRLTYQSPPLYHHYYLNSLFLPTSLPICL